MTLYLYPDRGDLVLEDPRAEGGATSEAKGVRYRCHGGLWDAEERVYYRRRDGDGVIREYGVWLDKDGIGEYCKYISKATKAVKQSDRRHWWGMLDQLMMTRKSHGW